MYKKKKLDSPEYPTEVLQDEKDKELVVSLGSPAELHCYALGYPYPAVTWWKEDAMVPLKTTELEQRQDYSLLIHSVKLSNLGLYTCQAYNGVGKAVSWTVTLRTVGPVHPSSPEDEKYMPFVVDPYERYTTSTNKPRKESSNVPVHRPSWPVRPNPNELIPHLLPNLRPDTVIRSTPSPRPTTPVFTGNFSFSLLTLLLS